jgi:hypothetical protein
MINQNENLIIFFSRLRGVRRRVNSGKGLVGMRDEMATRRNNHGRKKARLDKSSRAFQDNGEGYVPWLKFPPTICGNAHLIRS